MKNVVKLPDDNLVNDLMEIMRECEHQPQSTKDAILPVVHIKPRQPIPPATIVFDEDLLMQKLVIYISARDSKIFDHARKISKTSN